jgi:cytochrome c oxidase subunit IV
MGHSYTESKKIATKTISILAVITIAEVIFALTGKGYIINGFHMPHWLVGGVMIVMSVVKAYLIIYEFMHMNEVPALVKTVLIPTLLLVWAIIAFTYEGNYWQNARSKTRNLKSAATTEQVEHH